MHIIYHNGCPDGLLSAAILERKLLEQGNTTINMIPGAYNDPLPEIKDSTIYFVDFSCKLEVMNKFLEENNRIILLDHHKSAIKELGPILTHPNVEDHCSHDNTKSGTGLAWAYCYPDIEIPKPFAFIQDRDLWTWNLPESRDFCAGFNMVKPNLKSFREFVGDVLDSTPEELSLTVKSFIKAGKVINITNEEYYRKSIEQAGEVITLFDVPHVALINAPSSFTSNLGNKVLIDCPQINYVICWFKGPKGLHIGLRSRTGGPFDVSEIAKQIHPSGGGHQPSAGSFIPKEEFKTNPLAAHILN